MRCDACRCNGAGGGVFVSPAPAYADGYVDGTGNNIYYGFKTDASYAEAHFNIDVEYYDTFEHARDGGTTGIDPLGKFVRVHYLSNCHNNATADEWKFRPMWWFGVPAGLKDPQYIHFKRIEKLTKNGNQQVQPAGSSQYVTTDANGYGAVSDRHYNSTKEWSNLSNFYFSGDNIASKGWKQLVGLGDKDNSKTYDNAGDTEKQWNIYKQDTQGLKGIFVDWESAGRRWYDMTYVSEMEDATWKNRDQHPLRFAAGVYRFAGNWHYATAKKSDTPKIADHFTLAYPEVTKVKDPSNVTSTEQETIKKKIEAANKDTKHYSDLVDNVEVSDKGVATITFKDKTTRTMPASLLVTKDETDKDKYRPTLPTRTPVVNLKKLTPDEKTKIRQAIIDANGKETPNDFLKHVKKNADSNQYEFNVKEDGSVEVTYEDDSKLTIPAEDLVFQGPKISDWAPYVVPDPIEVKNLSSLTTEEQGKVTAAFDTANADLDVYTAAKKDGKTPVSFDKDFKNAIITWADGSTTEIPSWQFLKQKAAEENPTPKPPAPKPAEEKKTFTVDFSNTKSRVVPNFDPFNASSASEAAKNGVKAFKGAFKNLTAKDSDGKTVAITDVDFDFANGEVIFKAGDAYKDQRYPMSLLFKKGSTGTQNPTQQTPTSKTDTDPNNNKNTYKYFVTKTQISEAKVSDVKPQEVVKALKQFVKDNYTGWTEQDLASVTSNVAVGKNWKAKNGTTNLEPFNNGNGRITSISVSNDNGLTVNGYQYADQEDANIDVSTDGPLFTISADDLYAPNSGSQTPTDNTIENLRNLAKQLRDKRKTDGDLTDDVIKNTLKATDKDIEAMTDENALRDLIKKIADYQKPKPVEYKYNFEKLTLDHDGEPNDDDYKKIVVDQFLKKNYTTNDWSKLENAYSKSATVLSVNNANTYGLTPATSGTSGLNIYTGDRQAGGVTSVVVDSKTGDLVVRGWKAGTTSANAEELIRIKKADLFTPKHKDQNPAPSADNLKKFKEQAKEIINRNPKLTEEQKTQYKNEIDNADTKDKIQDILKKANEQAGKNNVDPNDIKKKENEEKEKREKEQKEKDEKERKEEEKKQLQKDKTDAKEALKNLTNLTDGDSGDKKKLSDEIDKAKTSEEVKKILEKAKAINDAKGALQNDITKGALPFLDHGNAGDDKKSETSHADDVALHELLGGTSGKDQTLTELENALKDTNATAESINKALAKAKLQNTSNEQNAKIAGIAKLDAKKAELDAAYNALNDDQKGKAKDKYEAALDAINTAKESVTKATTPSQIKTALDNLKTAIGDANTAIENAKGKRDTTQNTYDDQSVLNKEKEAQKKRINDSNLPKAEKQKAIDDINNAKKIGDPTAIANRALKAKKIDEALKKIDEFTHLNKAQKDAFKAIINGTDAGDHTNEDGTTTDDIDDALANAANTDNAMARLDELKKKANDFKNEQGGKYSKLDSTKPDEKKQKDDFDNYLKDATTLTTPDKGDAKGAAEVNTLYDDLLKAMRAIDPDAQSAGLKTDALSKEIELDKKLKPDTTAIPATKGDSVYTTASQDKKDAFDAALTAAEQALTNATKKDLDISTADNEAAEQKKVDEALDKLIKARLALDGVDTTALQTEIDKDNTVKDLDKYKYDDKSKTDAFDKALKDAKDLIDKLTGKKKAAAGEEDVTTKTQAEKQKALDDALAKLKAAEAALDGKKPAPTPVPTPVNPTPTPTPTPSVDKSHLQQGINDGSDVHNSDDYTNAPSDKKQAYDHALDHANEVNNDPNATQDQVNQAAEDLKKAENDLKPTPSPLPTPVPGGHEGDSSHGYGVNDNEPTTVDKGELNVQIQGAESDSQPGNAGNGNAGSNNAGNAANSGANSGNAGNTANNNAANKNASNANNANGANSAAVNAAVESNPAVKQADAQVSVAQAALDAALAEAKKVAADPNATQAQVDAASQKLADARKSLAAAQDNASKVRADVREQVLKRVKGLKLSKTGSDVSVFGMFVAGVAAAGAALFVSKRRGISRHCNK